ncbi:4'-phosphopantetheinyl transferase family protein [Brevibacillus reuszeri]|uniref:4'-phosphopantetheinyl transferase family protein n=1 Tax=Brevibacillus reuszeri TaxID=54915 RepID=UPI003D2252BE
MELFAIKLPESIEYSILLNLMTMVSVEQQFRLRRFRQKEDCYRSLLGELLIKYILFNKRNMPLESIVINRTKYGKPFIKDVNQVQFNISHSGLWVVCAISSNEIGIDIEEVRQIDDIDLQVFCRQFFSKEETIDLYSKSITERLQYFFELWTIKESFIKAVGTGMYMPVKSFTVRKDDRNIGVIFPTEFSSYRFKQYNIEHGYVLTMCSQNPCVFPSKLITCEFKAIQEFFSSTI